MNFRISTEEKTRRRDRSLFVLNSGKNLENRILAKIVIDARGCWIWQGYKDSRGYGSMMVADGTPMRCHTVSYFLKHGTIPEAGRHLDHFVCDATACCNPDHVRDVAARENILRGESLVAVQLSKTHCPKGHPYDEENTCHSGGGRICRTCSRGRMRTLGPIRYKKLKEFGICVKCGQLPAAIDRSMCNSCLDRHAARNRKSRLSL